MARRVFGLLACGSLLVVLAAVPAPAQDKLQPREGDKAVLGGLQDKLDGKENSRMSELKNGNRALTEDKKGNDDVLAKAARYYVYRLTMPKYWGIGEDDKDKASDPRTMTDLVREVNDQLLVTQIRKKQPLKPNQPEYVKALSADMLKCLREVFSKNGEPIVRINAARILLILAEAGQEECADTLLTLIENPREIDAVKLYALRGVKELLAHGTAEKGVLKPDVETRCVLTTQAFLTRKVDIPTDPQESAALNYVRREAVRALANSRYPLLPKNKDEAGRTAWWLLKVARRDGMTPDPSVSEQVEAAIGMCQLLPAKEVQFDYAAFHVGGAVVDFLNAYAQQKNNQEGAGLAWRLYATRLMIALDELQAHSGNSKYTASVVSRCKDALKPIDTGKDPNAGALEDWLENNQPPSKSVYTGIEAGIKPTKGGR
jgi:hypothetical protein